MSSDDFGVVSSQLQNESRSDGAVGQVIISDNATLLYDADRLVNETSIQLFSNGIRASLGIQRDVELSGGGTVLLSDDSNNLLYGHVGATLTNVDNVISGGGRLSLPIINENDGVIRANVSAPLVLDPDGGAFFNHGLLEASDGGTLRLLNGTFRNENGTIQALDDSIVDFGSGAIVEGGVVRKEGSGQLIGLSRVRNAILDSGGGDFDVGNESDGPGSIDGGGSSAGTRLVVRNGDTLTILGEVNNRGEILIDASDQLTQLRISDGSARGPVLSGGGTVTLADSPLSVIRGSTFYGTRTLANEDNLIQGGGSIGDYRYRLAFINEGLVDANADTALIINGAGGSRNEGLMQASNGGTLSLQGTLDNTNGVITAGSGSTVQVRAGSTDHGALIANGGGTVQFNGGRFAHGILTAQDNGSVELSSGQLLDVVLQAQSSGRVVTTGDNATITDTTISSGMTLEVLNGTTLNVTGDVFNRGEILIDASDQLTQLRISDGSARGTVLGGGGTVTLADSPLSVIRGSTFNGTRTLTNEDNLIQGGGSIGDYRYRLAFINEGLMQASDGGTLSLQGQLNNTNGILQVSDGSTIDARSANLNTVSGGVLSAGTYRVVGRSQTSRLILANAPILENAATVVLDGELATFDQISALGTNTGEFSVLGGQEYFTTDTLINAGIVQIAGAGSRIEAAGSYLQSAGRTVLDEGTLSAGIVEILGGSLEGNGTVDGDLIVGTEGSVGPGFSPGEIIVTGDFTLQAGGELFLEIGALESDRIVVQGGNVTLEGDVFISFLDDFLPRTGDRFDLFEFDTGFSLLDLGATFHLLDAPGGFDFDLQGSGNALAFAVLDNGDSGSVAAPEPTTNILLAFGLFLAFVGRKRAFRKRCL